MRTPLVAGAAAGLLLTVAGALPASAPVGALVQLPGTSGCVYTPPRPEDEVPDPLRGACAEAAALDGAVGVDASPDGRNVYVASFYGSSISAFSRDPATGRLRRLAGTDGCLDEPEDTVCGAAVALLGPSSVAVSPDGRNVYVTSFDSDAVVGFRRGPGGALAQLEGPGGCVSERITEEVCGQGRALVRPYRVGISPDGRNVYVGSTASRAVAVFARDPATGNLRQLSGADGCIANDVLDESEPCSLARAVGDYVAMSPDGANVYVASPRDDAVSVFARDRTSGKLTQLPGGDGCVREPAIEAEEGLGCSEGKALDGPFAVAVSPDGNNVYVATAFGTNDPSSDDPFAENGIAVFTRDRQTGKLTQLAGAAGCVTEGGKDGACADATALRGAVELLVSPDGSNLYVASQVSDAVAVFARDPATGKLSQLPLTFGCIGAGSPGACAGGRGLQGASSLAVSRDGRNVYATGPFDNAVAVFARTREPVRLRARLTGRAARPAGDPDGVGSARITLGADEFCWTLHVQRIGKPLAAHVHTGRSDMAGVLSSAQWSSPSR